MENLSERKFLLIIKLNLYDIAKGQKKISVLIIVKLDKVITLQDDVKKSNVLSVLQDYSKNYIMTLRKLMNVVLLWETYIEFSG